MFTLILVCIFFFLLFLFYFLVFLFKRKKYYNFCLCDKQEIYNFGKIGLVLVDQNNKILWINDFFKKEVYAKIKEFQNQLKEIKFGKISSNKILINSKNYEFEFFKKINLYIFKDIEDLSNVLEKLDNNSVVLGNIVIDNYPTTMNVNNDDYNESLANYISKIKNIIFDYAKQFNLFIKKYSANKYLVVCNLAALKDMEIDEFSLILKVRELVNEQDEIPLTLSIAFVHGHKDLNFLNDLVNNAINMITNRGGDQVVVCQDYDSFKFYNNKNNLFNSFENEIEYKTKVRDYANSLIKEVKKFDKIFISGHKNLDLDSLGSSLGIFKICQFFRKESYIIYDDSLVEFTAKNIFNYFLRNELSSIVISPKKVLSQIDEKTLIVMVDCNDKKNFLEEQILDKTKNIAIIDHHIFNKNSFSQISSSIFSYVDSNASSCVELIIEMLNYALIDIHINYSYANIMLAAILIDSNFFNSYLTSPRTFETVSFLMKSGADKYLVYDLLSDDLEINKLISKAILSIKETEKKGIFYCIVDSKIIKNSRIFLSKIAYRCIQIKNVNAIFVIGIVYNNEIYVLGRGNKNFNIQNIIEKMGGGGSFTSAIVKFKDKTLSDVEKMLLDIINNENNFSSDKENIIKLN